MDIGEPVEKAAALHVDAVDNAKVPTEVDAHTNIDTLKRRHSGELKREFESEAKKAKTSNNGANADEDEDDDLIAKLEAIDAPVPGSDATKPADLLKKLEEDGKSDDLLERMECIVEGKAPSNEDLLAQLEDSKEEKATEKDSLVKDDAKEEVKKIVPKAPEAEIKVPEVRKDSPKKEASKVMESPKKDVPKVVESPKKVESMDVDEAPKVVSASKNEENIISSTTEIGVFKNNKEGKLVVKESPKDINIPAQKSPTKVAPEVSSMADTKKTDTKVDTKSPAKDVAHDKGATKVPEKSEPTAKVQDKKDTDPEVLPLTSSSSDEQVTDLSKVQHNGLITSSDPSSTASDEDAKMDVDTATTQTPTKDTLANGKDTVEAVVVPEDVYEVKLCIEENAIKFLHIDKVDGGNEGASSTTEKDVGESQSTVTIKGISSLCSFVMEHMRKLSPDEEDDEETDDEKPKKRGRVPKSASKSDKPSPAVKAQGRRSAAKVSTTTSSPAVAKVTPKVAEKGGKDSTVGYAVMAKWVDKMYYAGRVSAEKTGGKFAIHFEDGALKTLNRDNIVFGQGNLMPFLNQSVHALVEGDTYEPGLVTEISMDQNDQIMYTVVTESKTVVRSASDIYLEEDQAKDIQASLKKDPQTGLVDLTTIKRITRRYSSASESSDASGKKKGRKSDSKGSDAEPGYSGGDAKKGRRGKRIELPPPTITLNESQSSDISDIPDTEIVPQSPETTALEAIDGVQPELQKTSKEIDRMRRFYFDEYLRNGRSLEDILGPIPKSRNLFRNKSFILTITFEGRSTQIPDYEGEKCLVGESQRVPFFKDHLQRQIEEGGGKVYQYWEDVPKNKYTNCKLIAPFPCMTAKYVQCLASGIHAISHEWIIESCRNNRTMDIKDYILPTGWSIIDRKYVLPVVKRIVTNSKALVDLNILLVSENKDFRDFWSRVCKLAGAASVQMVKSVDDISTIQKGFLLVGSEVHPVLIEKAKDFNISVVSTVWVVQSLISGACCNADAHESLTKFFADDC